MRVKWPGISLVSQDDEFKLDRRATAKMERVQEERNGWHIMPPEGSMRGRADLAIFSMFQTVEQ
jgi:hypothetical protein